MPLGKNKTLVHSNRKGITKILSSLQVQMLFACHGFDTVQNHATKWSLEVKRNVVKDVSARKTKFFIDRLMNRLIHYTVEKNRELLLRAQEIESVEGQLLEFVKAGFLTSDVDIGSEILRLGSRFINAPTSPNNSITSVGIPTRNRPKSLKRAVASYVENNERYGRTTNIVVVDDSERTDVREQNKQILHAFKQHHDVDIFYADQKQRAHLASVLARQADLPLEVLRFALLGDKRCNITTGACRNMLLLDTVGEICLQSDDDVVCKVAAVPTLQDGLTLTSQNDANEYWFFEDHSAVLESISFIDKDLLEIHEQLLGRKLGECLSAENSEGLCVDNISPQFLKNMSMSDTRVAVSFAGSMGDSGMHSTLPRLFFEGVSYERLTNPESSYRNNLNTRQILRAPTQHSISDGTFCIAMNMGLDNRILLPPFMPVQRSQDSIFGSILKICFEGASRGYLPYVVYHAPPERRSSITKTTSLDLKSIRTNDILRWIIFSLQRWPRESDTKRSISALGDYLMNLSSLPPTDFKNFVRTICCRAISTRILNAERRLRANSEAPKYWVDDINNYISASQKRTTSKDFFVPSDLEGSVDERWSCFSEIVHKFGELLTHWPTIVKAASDIRSKGDRLIAAI